MPKIVSYYWQFICAIFSVRRTHFVAFFTYRHLGHPQKIVDRHFLTFSCLPFSACNRFSLPPLLIFLTSWTIELWEKEETRSKEEEDSKKEKDMEEGDRRLKKKRQLCRGRSERDAGLQPFRDGLSSDALRKLQKKKKKKHDQQEILCIEIVTFILIFDNMRLIKREILCSLSCYIKFPKR